jgi:hypothetical protein
MIFLAKCLVGADVAAGIIGFSLLICFVLGSSWPLVFLLFSVARFWDGGHIVVAHFLLFLVLYSVLWFWVPWPWSFVVWVLSYLLF